MVCVAHAHPEIRQPAAVLRKAKVAVALTFTALPFCVKVNVAGTTAYARSGNNELPRRAYGAAGINHPILLQVGIVILCQLEQAPGPCHSYGGMSSMTDASSAHAYHGRAAIVHS
jgi:hypothetical protein